MGIRGEYCQAKSIQVTNYTGLELDIILHRERHRILVDITTPNKEMSPDTTVMDIKKIKERDIRPVE